MALADLIRGAPKPSATATAATRATAATQKTEPMSGAVAAVARVAVAKPPGVLSARWLLHFDAAEPIMIAADPPVEHTTVLAMYPTAIAAEPLSAPMPQELSPAVARMFAECVEAGLYDEAERPVLRAMHAADPDGTRVLVAEMHARIGRCYGCQHFSQPGLSDGYCGGREDLPHAYGPGHPLRGLPVDGGATCTAFKGRT